MKTFTIPPVSNNSMKMFFEKIDQPDSVKNMLVDMSKGNPGGATVLVKLFEGVKPEDALKDIEILNEAGIYGGNLWIGFKDLCNQDIEEFRKKLHDEDLVQQITDSRYFIQYE